MILEFDGLDRLWEDGVNWATINPLVEGNYNIVNNNINDNEYIPTQHDEDNFAPTFVHDLIPANEVHGSGDI